MHFEYLIDGQPIALELERRGEGEFVARFGEEAWTVQAAPVDDRTVVIRLGDRVFLGSAADCGTGWHVAAGGRHLRLEDAARAEGAGYGADDRLAGRILVSPMPGTVVKLVVKTGEAVERGQLCAVVEAMKMENELRAGCRGTVSAVRVAEKQQVAGGEVLVEIEPAEE
jgi:acetyl/propionyl-CoA carboxylase alpha subunit